MITYKVLDNTKETAEQLEFIRLSSYGFTPTKKEYDELYIRDITNNKILVFACYLNEELIAGCYVSNTFNSLYIDYIFVLPEYQEQGLHIGRNLLQFILDNKHIVEEYFNTIFDQSKLFPSSLKSQSIYEKMGYKPDTQPELLCKKLGN